MRLSDELIRFDYGQAKLSDVKTYGVRSTRTGQVTITAIEIHGTLYSPSLCFWRSFFNRFDVPTHALRFFDPSEILERVQQRAGNAKIRFSVQFEQDGSRTLMVICGENSLRFVQDFAGKK